MKPDRRLVFLGILASLLLTACGGGNSNNSSQSFVSGNGTVTFKSPESRKSAPDLTGRTLDGGKYEMVRGRVTVVNVWASWCAPCRAEAPALASLSQTFSSASFVGILTRDNIPSAKAFVRRFKVPYPTLIDDSILLRFQGALAANAIPTTLVIDKKGRVAARISGQITVASLTDIIEKVSAE